MSDDAVQKLVNDVAAVAVQAENPDNGPARLLTVPTSTTKQGMEEMLDVWMALPSSVIGQVLVVHEGVTVIPLGRRRRRRKSDDCQETRSTYVFEVPRHYDTQEIQQLVDMALALPDDVISNVVVVSEGVTVTPL